MKPPVHVLVKVGVDRDGRALYQIYERIGDAAVYELSQAAQNNPVELRVAARRITYLTVEAHA